MDQSGVVPAPSEQLRDAGFLAEVLPLNELDLQPRLPGQFHNVIPQRVALGFGENAQVKATNSSEAQLSPALPDDRNPPNSA